MVSDPVINGSTGDRRNACAHHFICQNCGIVGIDSDSDPDSDSDSQPPPLDLEHHSPVEFLTTSLASLDFRAPGEEIENSWVTSANIEVASSDNDQDHLPPPPYTAPLTPEAALDAVTPGRGLPYVPATIEGGPGVVQPPDDILRRLYAGVAIPPLLPPYDASKAHKRCYLVASGRPAYSGDTGYGIFFEWHDANLRVNRVRMSSHQGFSYNEAYLIYYRLRASGNLKTLT